MPRMIQTDVEIRGGGVVGKALALALSHQGLRVTLVGRATAPHAEAKAPDVRAYALNASSRHLLQKLKVWDALPKSTVTPVYEMHVAGDALGSELTFSSWQQGVEALAWIVETQALEHVLDVAVQFAPKVVQVAATPDSAGRSSARLLAVCEGKESWTRARLDVPITKDHYGQRAIAARLSTEFAHGGTAHQWFASPDILALLPMDGQQEGRTAALVWSVDDARAEQLLALPAADFEDAVSHASGGTLGKLTLASDRFGWRLQRTSVERWCGPGWVLVGDAAHGVHPLAGQGLNLGLADVASLTRVLSEREPWRALGDEKLLRRYARERAAPTWLMSQGIDALWQLFAARSTGATELRNRGLNLLNHLPLLKRLLAGQALGV